MQVIANLGGVFLNSSSYDDSATHIVISKLSCNEKLLASIAAGKWVMHPDWLIESHRKGIFIDELPYEWGNPSLSVQSSCSSSSSGSQSETEIAGAAHYWRLNRSQGPFHGMRVLMKLGDNKNAPFKRLLEIGGGEVVEDE
jgi:topoisomerase (DNA) II binding protein 1